MADHDQPDSRQNGIADLLRRLSEDASTLVRNEIALARLEVRQAAQLLVRDSAKLGVAFTLLWIGALALTAAMIIGVAHLLGDRYAIAALIVGVLFVAVGALLGRNGIKGISTTSLKPETAMRTLGESREWAAHELSELKQELSRARAADAALPAAAPTTADRPGHDD